MRLGAAGTVIRYGYYGRPVLVFPAEMGRASDFESRGMIDTVGDLVEGLLGGGVDRSHVDRL